jgi:N-hydroxyarylamine O-acetyltransferase
MSDHLPEDLKEQVLAKLGFNQSPPLTLAGLNALYQAWCFNIPFENVSKMIGLLQSASPLPGQSASEYFSSWLAHGSGGTCWPGANALFMLIDACGFKARRVAASMLDLGEPTHGTVKINIEGKDWMADASILSNEVLPLDPTQRYVHGATEIDIEVEPVDDGFRIWFETAIRKDKMPCRLLDDPSDFEFFCFAYEESRTRSPFNESVYVHRHQPGKSHIQIGQTQFIKSGGVASKKELSGDEIVASLINDMALSEEIVEKWVAVGGLESTLTKPIATPVT